MTKNRNVRTLCLIWYKMSRSFFRDSCTRFILCEIRNITKIQKTSLVGRSILTFMPSRNKQLHKFLAWIDSMIKIKFIAIFKPLASSPLNLIIIQQQSISSRLNWKETLFIFYSFKKFFTFLYSDETKARKIIFAFC